MSKTFAVMFALYLFPLTSCSQERVVLVVKAFTVDSESALPYDMKQLQISTHAILKTRFAKDAVVVVTEEPPAAGGNIGAYALIENRDTHSIALVISEVDQA